MLKKLKHKFILINMLLVGVVILSIFTAVCILTYRSEKNEVERALEQVVSMKGGDIPHIGSTDNEFPLPYVYAFSVLVDNSGTIIKRHEIGTEMDEEMLTQAIAEVMNQNEKKGTIQKFELLYLKKEVPEGYVIAFASSTSIKVAMKNTILISVAACILSLLIFLGVSVCLAGYAMKPIEQAWRRQKQFVADASHDLKTPLTVILANTNILASHKDEIVDSQIKWIESTEEEAQHMRGLVDRMLELAKSESMTDKLTFSDISFSELLQRAVLQFEPVAFEKNVTLESEIASNILVKGNTEACIRLIHILIDNAVKYSPPGECVTVRLSCAKQVVKFSVHNGGNAIPAEDLPHIFERFYRADKARSVGGYGLGLSIAKNLAEMLGGEIRVQSDMRGTTFTVFLKG